MEILDYLYNMTIQLEATREAAAHVGAQTGQRVDTWMKEHAAGVQPAWEDSPTGRQSWEAFASTQGNDATARQAWQETIRNPAVLDLLVWQAVEEGLTSARVAQAFLSPENRVDGLPQFTLGMSAAIGTAHQLVEEWKRQQLRNLRHREPASRTAPTSPTREEERGLAHRAGEHAWHQTLTPSAARHQESAGREDRALPPAATRAQHARSQHRQGRGLGQRIAAWWQTLRPWARPHREVSRPEPPGRTATETTPRQTGGHG